MTTRPMATRRAAPEPAPAPGVGWQVVGASVRGAAHARLGWPCQDAHDYRVLPNGVLLIAVADGAGSARFSDEGARCAVQAALQAMETALAPAMPRGAAGEPVIRDAFAAARQAVLQLARDPEAAPPGAPVTPEDLPGDGPADGFAAIYPNPAAGAMPGARDYASTLTCVIAGAGELAVGQIGDGAVVAVDAAGELFSASRLQRGEYANETHFLTQAGALDQAVIEVIRRPVEALAVMSDGLIRLALKMPAQEPHLPFFQPLFQFARAAGQATEAVAQLTAFLQSERVNARTDDDKTLVLAICTPGLQNPRAAAAPEQEPAALANPPAAARDAAQDAGA